METTIQIFTSDVFGEVRTMTNEKGEVLFVGKDVATALGYSNTRDAMRKHVDEEDKTTVAIRDTGSNYKSKAVFINESGLYALILSSELYRWLVALSIVYWQSGEYMLYADFAREGFAKTRTHGRRNRLGVRHTQRYLVWTEAGRKFLHEVFSEKPLHRPLPE